MNYLEQMKKCSQRYDNENGWYVVSYGRFWYVGLIEGGYIQRSKKVGKVQCKGVNYFDRACDLADERNKKDGFAPVNYCHIPRVHILDDCEVCGGTSGGVKGNENIIDGVVMCDYCSAKHK